MAQGTPFRCLPWPTPFTFEGLLCHVILGHITIRILMFMCLGPLILPESATARLPEARCERCGHLEAGGHQRLLLPSNAMVPHYTI